MELGGCPEQQGKCKYFQNKLSWCDGGLALPPKNSYKGGRVSRC